MTYSEKLLDPRWQKKRLIILERDNWKCRLCDDDQTTLHIHHNKYSGEPWDAYNEDLITCCKHCHFAIELIKEDIPDAIIVRVNKYHCHNIDQVLLVCIVRLEELHSIYFIGYSETKKAPIVLSIIPEFIRDVVKEMDKIKSELDNLKAGSNEG